MSILNWFGGASLSTSHNKILDRLLLLIGVLTLLILITEIIGLYYVSLLYAHTANSIQQAFFDVWLPTMPFILLFSLACVGAFLRWKPIMILLLILTPQYGYHCARALTFKSIATGFAYWASYLSLRLTLLMLIINLITFILWMTFRRRNKKIARS